MSAKVIKTHNEYRDIMDIGLYESKTSMIITGGFFSRFKKPKHKIKLSRLPKDKDAYFPSEDLLDWLLKSTKGRADVLFVNDMVDHKFTTSYWDESLKRCEVAFSDPREAMRFKLVWGGV